jgi:bifunctional non-homologous end joining protein LigD
MQYAFSLPTKATRVPAGSDWMHKTKYDGYRMMLVRENDRVRFDQQGQLSLARYFPLIVSAGLKLRQERFVIDGEAMLGLIDHR